MRYPHWRQPCRQLMSGGLNAAAAIVLLFYIVIGLLDSIHFQVAITKGLELRSLLDLLMQPLGQQTEATYSAPFSNHVFTQSAVKIPLIYTQGSPTNITIQSMLGVALGLGVGLVASILFIIGYTLHNRGSWRDNLKKILLGKTQIAWRSIWITFTGLWILIGFCMLLSTHYHILGTDKIGRDVFYLTIKSIRTGLIVGTITTLFMLPFALFLGAIAGYFRGWVDDIIQYCYTTLSSIPGVLLISASVLVLQVYMAKNAGQYSTLAQRADIRLLALCFILAITGWADLCRFLRAETLKLRELEFVQAAKALGVKQITIVWRHIIPNVFHIVIITLVLDFSALVLAEAVLSYVGVGVDPTTISWGNMINTSRLELAREPAVWWPLLAALIAMFGLVFAANIFADAVRDVFDPYLRID